MQSEISFGGETFNEARDGDRLRRQLDLIHQTLDDGRQHTLATLAAVAQCSVASASARLRDLRKHKYGAYCIDREYAGGGIWLYRLVQASTASKGK